MGTNAYELPDALLSTDLASVLQLSQQTPSVLSRQSAQGSSYFNIFKFAPDDNSERFNAIERHFHACLQSGDDESALLCLDRLAERFGSHNGRIMGLRGLYEEATSEHVTSLEKRLHDYEKIISEDPVNVVCTVGIHRNSIRRMKN